MCRTESCVWLFPCIAPVLGLNMAEPSFIAPCTTHYFHFCRPETSYRLDLLANGGLCSPQDEDRVDYMESPFGQAMGWLAKAG